MFDLLLFQYLNMKKETLQLIIFCITLPVFLTLFSYKIVLLFSDLDPAQQNTIDFVQGEEELQLNYTSKEISHLQDVKEVMRWTEIVFFVSLLFSTLIITTHRKRKKALRKLFFFGGLTTTIGILMVLFFSLVSFPLTFTIFHHLFFPQGNWMFAADSMLIQTFPGRFFFGLSVKIFLLTLLLGIISVFFKKGKL